MAEWSLDLTEGQIEALREDFENERDDEVAGVRVVTLSRDQLVAMLADLDRVSGLVIQVEAGGPKVEDVRHRVYVGYTWDAWRCVTPPGWSVYDSNHGGGDYVPEGLKRTSEL